MGGSTSKELVSTEDLVFWQHAIVGTSGDTYATGPSDDG